MKSLLLAFVLLTILPGTVNSQEVKIPIIGSKAPSFTATSTNGEITFPEGFGKNWKILFSHPADFTPVCSSEILELAHLQKNFKDLGVKIAIVSTNDIEKHKLWKADLEKLNYKGRGPLKIDFPLIDDHQFFVSEKYGMLQDVVCKVKDVRGVFIIDPENVIRSINFYPMNIGRNMDEIIRIVRALQTSDKYMVSIPANWNKGDDVLKSFPYTNEQLAIDPSLSGDYYVVSKYMWFKKLKE